MTSAAGGGSPTPHRIVDAAELAPPSGFAHAVVAAHGRTVFLGGQIGMDGSGRVTAAGLVEQFDLALANLLTALRAAGGGPEHLASLTIYIVDVADYRAHAREFGAVWRRLAGTEYPAMAGIGIARLWDDDALVEVQGVAELPEQA